MDYGLIGEKLGHSFSKDIHSFLNKYNYDLKEVPKDKFNSFILKKEFKGLNVTIPYKETIIPFIDKIDEIAIKIGAVNTVLNRNGVLYGYNTDFGGLLKLVEKYSFDFTDKKVLILGSGGTSKTAFCVAEYKGASEIYKISRNGEYNYNNVYELFSDADIIINTTPCGMYPDTESCAVDVDKFSNLSGVIDVVYNPLDTKLVRDAKKRGVKAVGGLYMLTSQAVLASELFADIKYDDAVFDEIYNFILNKKLNIVLTGMPGSGKSTVGKRLSEITGKEFIDTDELIVETSGSEIKDIFDKHGEAYFRNLEREAVKKASSKNGVIIATGGGAVLKDINIDYLSSNGKIFFLNRPLENIIPTDDRPLSCNYEALKKRFEERFDIYKSTADIEINSSGSVEEAVECILECLK